MSGPEPEPRNESPPVEAWLLGEYMAEPADDGPYKSLDRVSCEASAMGAYEGTTGGMLEEGS